MQIQVNTDKNISGNEASAQNFEDILRRILGRFSDQITRIEAHLSDDNSAATFGVTDKHCLLEVRLAGQQPIASRAQAQTVEQAVTDAARKMISLLETDLGRRDKR